jgi:hypothetical protein
VFWLQEVVDDNIVDQQKSEDIVEELGHCNCVREYWYLEHCVCCGIIMKINEEGTG